MVVIHQPRYVSLLLRLIPITVRFLNRDSHFVGRRGDEGWVGPGGLVPCNENVVAGKNRNVGNILDELFESFGLVRKLVNLPQPVSVFSGDMAPTADYSL